MLEAQKFTCWKLKNLHAGSVKISDTGVYGKIPALCPQRSSLGYIAIVYWIYYNYDYNYKAGCLLAATWNYISIR